MWEVVLGVILLALGLSLCYPFRIKNWKGKVKLLKFSTPIILSAFALIVGGMLLIILSLSRVSGKNAIAVFHKTGRLYHAGLKIDCNKRTIEVSGAEIIGYERINLTIDGEKMTLENCNLSTTAN
jgi:hypothetical protein